MGKGKLNNIIYCMSKKDVVSITDASSFLHLLKLKCDLF